MILYILVLLQIRDSCLINSLIVFKNLNITVKPKYHRYSLWFDSNFEFIEEIYIFKTFYPNYHVVISYMIPWIKDNVLGTRAKT